MTTATRILTGNHRITDDNVHEYADVIEITGNAAIRVACPALTTVGGDARIYVDCPALTTVGGDADIDAACPALQSIGGYADIDAACPALQSIGGVPVWSKERQIAHRKMIAPFILSDALDMGDWGVENGTICGTTACLAGWAQDRCDDPAIKALHPASAGAITLGPDIAPYFYKSNEAARELARQWLEDA